MSAFDINLGCSGYTYGIFNAAAMVGEQRFRRVLVLVGDQAASNDGLDNGRDILFGDACTATALEYDPTAQPSTLRGFPMAPATRPSSSPMAASVIPPMTAVANHACAPTA